MRKFLTAVAAIILFTILSPEMALAQNYPSGDAAFRIFVKEHWSTWLLDGIPIRPYQYRNVLRLPYTHDGIDALKVTMVITYRPCVPEDRLPAALRGHGFCLPVPQSELPEVIRGVVINDRIEVIYHRFLEGWIPVSMSTFFVSNPDKWFTKTIDIPIFERPGAPPQPNQ